ncbi:MAG: C-GCAxxG-C-C family protein [Clostridia bacterium]|nr:C-GCAxxG-C-C family protein [Clostridia bacterium]
MEERMLELARAGMACSQIMMQLALDTQGMENADLVRAMSGLTRGMGRTGHTCGVLTAGCAIIGLFTGQGDMEEPAHPDVERMIADYVEWFMQNVAQKHGGCDCRNIVNGDFSKSISVCLPIVQDAFEFIMNMLMEKGVFA